ncbi:MAG: ABC transporter permease, partial [Clostridiales bacterium]|nr:ABC transporter permease [Clostridiales bacterium]
FMGTGLRETIQLKEVGGAQILSGFLEFSAFGVNIPTGNLAVFAAFCLLVWLFFRSRAGIAISAGGISPMFARSSGIDTDKARVMANMLSTMLGALGIIVYAQTYGFIQLYNAPRDMAFPAVAAVLVGGATARRAKISHVVIGTLLFQGLLATAPAVANRIFEGTDLSEIMRMIVQNGIILYALTQVKGGDQ